MTDSKQHAGNPFLAREPEARAFIQALKSEDVRSVYSGKVRHCCCGCSGNHRYHPDHIEEAGKHRGYPIDQREVSHRSVVRVLNKVKRDPASVLEDPEFVTLETSTRLFVVYLTNAAHACFKPSVAAFKQ